MITRRYRKLSRRRLLELRRQQGGSDSGITAIVASPKIVTKASVKPRVVGFYSKTTRNIRKESFSYTADISVA